MKLAHILSSALLLLLPLFAEAEMRVWTSAADPTKQFKGELKESKDNQVTILMADGRVAMLEIGKLSKGDQEFIRLGKEPSMPKPLDPVKDPFDPERFIATMILDFEFGESPDQVYVRLKKHGAAEGGVNEILRGRTGLNDHFFLTIGEVRYGLFFEFDDSGLIEVSLQSKGFAPETFNTSLRDTWKEVREGIIKNHGKSVLDGNFPDKSTLAPGTAISTDVWKTGSGKQIYLGLGFQEGNYSCLIRSHKNPFIP